jgi:gp54 protein
MTVNRSKRRKFYKSAAWLRKRKEIVDRDNNECQLCKSNGYATVGQMTALDVHHKEHLEDNWQRRLDNDNLITLCRSCHNLQHPEKLKEFNSDVHQEKFE